MDSNTSFAHPKGRGNLLYRYNPETKRIQYWVIFSPSSASRWQASFTFRACYPDERAARAEIRKAGYAFTKYASTFCEPSSA